MTETSKGWVVVNENHPGTTKPYIIASTFAYYKKDSITKFLAGSREDWRYWYKKWNFRCVKAEVKITTKP